MYVRDKSVPTSALTNTQTENGDLFISGQIAMEIAHPSEYAAMIDKAKKATGADKDLADEVVANMAYGLMPAGPVRRAVVFGGSNIHIFSDQYAGHTVDRKAADAFIAFTCGPEWSVKNSGNWTGSNPGNLQGFKTDGMKQRLDSDQVPRRDHVDAAVRRAVPGHPRVDRDHEQHRAEHGPERADRHDDGQSRRPTTRPRRSKR